MTFDIVLVGLFVVSLLSSLLTEAVKNILERKGKEYAANVLAGYCSVGLSVVLGVGYMILAEVAFNAKAAVYLIALMFLSWLSSMCGYDKVIQTITQLQSIKQNGKEQKHE